MSSSTVGLQPMRGGAALSGMSAVATIDDQQRGYQVVSVGTRPGVYGIGFRGLGSSRTGDQPYLSTRGAIFGREGLTDIALGGYAASELIADLLRQTILIQVVAMGNALQLQSSSSCEARWLEQAVGRLEQSTNVAERIKGFGRLPRGWAGAESVPAEPRVVALALQAVRELPIDLELPQATLSAEGEIGLTWVDGDDRFDALIDEDRQIVWMSNIAGRSYAGNLLDMTAGGRLDELYAAVSEFYRFSRT